MANCVPCLALLFAWRRHLHSASKCCLIHAGEPWRAATIQFVCRVCDFEACLSAEAKKETPLQFYVFSGSALSDASVVLLLRLLLLCALQMEAGISETRAPFPLFQGTDKISHGDGRFWLDFWYAQLIHWNMQTEPVDQWITPSDKSIWSFIHIWCFIRSNDTLFWPRQEGTVRMMMIEMYIPVYSCWCKMSIFWIKWKQRQ